VRTNKYFRTVPTKYDSLEAAETVANVFRTAGHDAVVVPGKVYPEYRVRIYTPANQRDQVSRRRRSTK
jgi:signal recognition particle subunit SEC65